MKKIKIISTIIFIITTLVLAVFSLSNIKQVKTDLISGFLSSSTEKNRDVIKLSKLASNKMHVIFETTDYYDNEDLRDEFLSSLDTNVFSVENKEFLNVLDLYKSKPHNFLTEHKRTLLKNKDYSKIDKESLEDLYNPIGIMLETPDKDPYLFLTSYLKSFDGIRFTSTSNVISYKGKYYSELTLVLNSDISYLKGLEKLKNQLVSGDVNIYFTGPLIHSYMTSSKSVVEINTICVISVLALVLLCGLYFKSLKIFVPIGLSIFFGIGFGYLVTNLIFDTLNILTFVFSTTLIGISLDYSLHFYMTERKKTFYKSLTVSMLTTVLAFLTLLFTGVEVLKEIAIFTAFGLIGVYLFVVLILPLFNFGIKKGENFSVPDLSNFKTYFLIVIGLTFLSGLCRLTFNDDIKALYVPPQSLLKAETLYKNIYETKDKSFIVVKGKDLDEIIKNEEKITQKLENENVPYISLTKLVPSERKQKENQKLIKELYLENLDVYANFLDKSTISKLKNSFDNDKVESLDLFKYPYLKNFLLDENTSFIIVPAEYMLEDEFNQIVVSKDISAIVKSCRKHCQYILPVILFVLIGLLVGIYGFNKARKIILSPFLGIIFAVGLLSLLGCSMNIFSILALFLILGFSLDYSIFRASGDANSKKAVLISCISTVFSFFLLSLTSFTLISSMGKVLCIGILTSYILSLVLLPENDKV